MMRSACLLVLLSVSCATAADYAELIRADRPVAWWRFEESAKAVGGRARDHAGDRCPGEYRGTVASVPGLPGTGPGARAAHFNGKDTYVHVPLTDALRLDVLTVEFWFRSTQAFDARFWPGSAVFISTATSGPGSGDWLITAASQRRVDEGRLLAETGPRGKTKDLYLESREGEPLNDGFWHHVVLTRSEEGKACLYVDGALHASGNDGRGRIVAERALNIGGESIHPGGKYLEGEMDEVAIYALVLSAERVRTHYEAIRPHLGNRPERRVVPVPVGKPAKPERDPSSPAPLIYAKPVPLAEHIAASARSHWAFQPIHRPTIPNVHKSDWGRNAIDAFILTRLDGDGLLPRPPADAHTLLRRASFDLRGLPPSLKEMDALEQRAEGGLDAAYEILLERLLASPHYGERYGRHWLDVVRYADSAGYEVDYYYHHAAPYRDYVISSFNDDKPFDRFVREQLAADELWAKDESLQFASGILTLAPWKYSKGVDRKELAEHERLTNVADTIGSAFLGLTVGCARCHDHKSDPISQFDYYGLHAVLAPARLWDVEKKTGAYQNQGNSDPKTWIIKRPTAVPVVRLLDRGEFSIRGLAVPPSLFTSIPGSGPAKLPEARPEAFHLRRARLADWLLSPENPLTARVIANRVWSWHFGTGLVRTANDFGPQGEAPSHPELLDYLAGELVRNGWKLKPLHRLIMSSATYRMASRLEGPLDGVQRDPANNLLWRFPRRRLEAEAIWDNLHATAGTLNLKRGGPAVVPPISKDLAGTLLNTNWSVSKDESEWTRRGGYVVVRRSLKFPFFDVFNVNTPTESCGRRDRTVVSPQALHLLNGPVAVKQARSFSGRLLRECTELGRGGDDRVLVRLAWRYAFGREASDAEQQRSVEFLRIRSRDLSEVKESERPAPHNAPKDVSSARAGAVVELCLALFNTNEFIYVD